MLFISTIAEARDAVAARNRAMDGPVAPIAFTTVAVEEVRVELAQTRCPRIDLFGQHMNRLEELRGSTGAHVPSALHGVGDQQRYNARMAAVEYAIEHDDGQTLRALAKLGSTDGEGLWSGS
jgi:regulator of PEP synthase PpsR (kinase-PPPase family)